MAGSLPNGNQPTVHAWLSLWMVSAQTDAPFVMIEADRIFVLSDSPEITEDDRNIVPKWVRSKIRHCPFVPNRRVEQRCRRRPSVSFVGVGQA